MSKKTGIQAVYNSLSSLKDNTTFTNEFVYRRLPAYTISSVNNALYKMEKNGALKRNNDGSYTVLMDKLEKWGNSRTWKASYPDRTGKRKAAKAPTDAEVMGNLVAAIAAAQSVIEKYQKIAEAMNDLN